MKSIKTLLIIAIATISITFPAKAQFHFGIQAGIMANDLKFSDGLLDSSNRIGFTGGITGQVDIAAFAIQASLMYAHRTSDVGPTKGDTTKSPFAKDYLTLPIHFKLNMGLPGLKNILRPFIFTGPSFSYLLSSRDDNGYPISFKKGDIDWDFGFGADIVKHIQLTVGYGLGVTKAAQWIGTGDSFDTNVRQNSWTITLGYLF